jgi:tetratricopeptide (TPR) repeat protein
VGFYGLMRAQQVGSALDYIRYGEEAAAIAAETGDPALRAGIGTLPAFGNFYMGAGTATLAWSGRVLEDTGSDNALGKEISGYSPRAAMHHARSNGLLFLGRLDEAWSAVREAERVAEETGELEVLGWVYVATASLSYICGGAVSVLEQGHRCLEIAEKLDNESSRMLAHNALGLAHLIDGQPAAACEAFRESVAVARNHSSQLAYVPQSLAGLAEAHLALGERAEAASVAREAIELSRPNGLRYYETQAQIVLAAALLATDDELPRAEIESALERAEELVESLEARSLSPRILEQRGRLAAALGDSAASGSLLAQALDLYREIGATGHAERLAREIAG